MVDFVNNVRSLVNDAIFCELCGRMRSEVDCAKLHHRVISEGLPWFIAYFDNIGHSCYGQLTPVKTRYPLTSIICPYSRLKFRAY